MEFFLQSRFFGDKLCNFVTLVKTKRIYVSLSKGIRVRRYVAEPNEGLKCSPGWSQERRWQHQPRPFFTSILVSRVLWSCCHKMYPSLVGLSQSWNNFQVTFRKEVVSSAILDVGVGWAREIRGKKCIEG